jgi:superfamily I DNA and RNA helicase
MEVNTTGRRLQEDPASSELVEFLEANQEQLALSQAELYHDFPLYKAEDGSVVVSRLLLASPNHGVVGIATSSATSAEALLEELPASDSNLNIVFDYIYSKLARNRALKKSRTVLKFPVEAFHFAPFVPAPLSITQIETHVLFSYKNVSDFLAAIRLGEPLSQDEFLQLRSSIEGAGGLIKPKPRSTDGLLPRSRGYIAALAEAQIASFDRSQKHGYMSILDGAQRIRGLAGSGKTVVLAMKAALTHLRHPDATVLYTFYTRSLYQYIRRLVTRFYRQFHDQDPDWTRLHILHAWGGYTAEGVYFNACQAHGVQPVPFSEASRSTASDPFDFVCTSLMREAEIRPMYDYVLVDEGQDFPNSFLRLCSLLAHEARVVFAYDELQTIFQTTVPKPTEFLPTNAELTEDTVLYKCYRNPREVLVSAHALGLGLYSHARIVQMLENKDHWEDIGYHVVKGEFKEGTPTIIERPPDNSLSYISDAQAPSDIVQAHSYQSFREEVTAIATSIKADISDGLLPEDILVVVVDDRNAKGYLNTIAALLAEQDIATNNVHADGYALRDFQREGKVTLSTIHKAKGNEAYMVYVAGVDALFSTYAGIRERNMLFTAMTRAKGWVRVSGIGHVASSCVTEVEEAMNNFPYLRFSYPSEKDLKVMRRDLAERDIRKQKAERMLDKVLEEMSPEQVRRFIEQRSIKKGDA